MDAKEALIECARLKRDKFLLDNRTKKFIWGAHQYDAESPMEFNIKNDNQPPYTLMEVWYCLLHYKESIPAYIKKCNEMQLRFVSFLHRRQICLELGLPDNFEPLEIMEPAELLKRPRPDQDEVPAAKRSRKEATTEEKLAWVEYLRSVDQSSIVPTEMPSQSWDSKSGPPGEPLDESLKAVIDADGASAWLRDSCTVLTRFDAARAREEYFLPIMKILAEVKTGSKDKEGQSEKPTRVVRNGREPPVHVVPVSISNVTKTVFEPYIIVPSAVRSLLSLWNAKEFLEDGVFETTEKVKRSVTTPKPPYVIVSGRKFLREAELKSMKIPFVNFRVIDSVQRFEKNSQEWDKVAGVFVTGAKWQFRGWFSEDSVQILTKIAGFHLTYAEDRSEQATQGWRCRHLRVSNNPHKRYLDPRAVREFWLELYRHILHSPQFQALMA